MGRLSRNILECAWIFFCGLLSIPLMLISLGLFALTVYILCSSAYSGLTWAIGSIISDIAKHVR